MISSHPGEIGALADSLERMRLQLLGNIAELANWNDVQDAGGDVSNENDRRNGPHFMNGSDLQSPYILAGQEVTSDTSVHAAGAVVPGYILTPVTGSRADVSAKGVWADGIWVLVLTRALDSGNQDDVVFTPPKPVAFGIATVDNGGSYNHLVYSEVLTLSWK